MNAWMDGWIDGCMDRWIGGWVGRWMEGWMGTWMGGWVDGRMGRWMGRHWWQPQLGQQCWVANLCAASPGCFIGQIAHDTINGLKYRPFLCRFPNLGRIIESKPKPRQPGLGLEAKVSLTFLVGWLSTQKPGEERPGFADLLPWPWPPRLWLPRGRHRAGAEFTTSKFISLS